MSPPHILAVIDAASDKNACAGLEKHYELKCVSTLRPALRCLKHFEPDLLLIDVDASTRGNVKRVLQAAKAHYRRPFVLLIKSGRASPREITYYDHLLSRPFVFRKLKSAIDKLLRSRPGYVLSLAPLTLDRRTQVLQHSGGVTQLTPKMAQIMAMLLLQAGKPVSARTLLTEVWQREKDDNARPLHVHIHWLRKIIEEDAKRPKLLKTAPKNNGYLLDIPGKPTIGGEPLYVMRKTSNVR